MSSAPPPDRAALGRARLAARARRIALIRRRVIAATLATFALAWGAIAWDGSMGATASTTAQTSASTDTASGDSTPSPEDSSSSAPSVTTSQS